MDSQWCFRKQLLVIGSLTVLSSSCRVSDSSQLNAEGTNPVKASFNLSGDYNLEVSVRQAEMPNTIKAIVTDKDGKRVPGVKVNFGYDKASPEFGRPYNLNYETSGEFTLSNAFISKSWPPVANDTDPFITDKDGIATAFVDATTPGYVRFNVSLESGIAKSVYLGKRGLIINDGRKGRSNVRAISIAMQYPRMAQEVINTVLSNVREVPRLVVANLSPEQPRYWMTPLHYWKIYDSNVNRPVNLKSLATLTATATGIRIDFLKGIGGSLTDAVGNGSYKVSIKEISSGPTFDYSFYRLAGDVNASLWTDQRDNDYGVPCTINPVDPYNKWRCLNADANGDGLNDAKDVEMINSFRDYRIGNP